MTVRVRSSGAWTPLGSASVFISGKWRAVRAIRVFKGGSWRLAQSFGASLGLQISPPLASGQGFGDKPESVASELITALVTGGQQPFSYTWTVTGTSGVTVNLSSPNAASTTAFAFLNNNSVTATLRCVVTDATGATATANSIVLLEHGFI